MLRSLLTVTLFILLASCLIQAQSPANVPPSQPTPDPAVTKQAFELLEAIAGEITNLRAPHNRIHAEAVVADLLWSHDEKRARGLFKSATAELVSLVANIDFSDQEAYQEVSFINQLRQQIVDRLAAHDPELALTFVRETRFEQSPTDTRPGWFNQNETSLELHLAELIAARDPARALKLARATLAQGVSYPTLNFLSQIQQKDPASAQTLYREIVDRIKDEDIAHNQEQANVGWNLLGVFQPPQANEDIYRELIETLTSAALGISPVDRSGINFTQNLSNAMQPLMPQIEKYAAPRAAALRQWSQAVDRSLDPGTRMWRELNEIGQSGTVDDVLALAQKYAPEYRNQIYQNAAWKAFSSGDGNRARQIISDNVTDPIQRRQMLENFDNQALNNAAGENKVATVRQLLTKVKAVDRKIQILVQMAANLAGKGNKTEALDLLNEARTLAAGARGAAQLSAQLSLVQAYSTLDIDQSFPIMQTVVSKANEVVAAAVVLDGFENRYLNKGEWMMPGQTSLSNLINTLNFGLANLAHYDLGRARALADQLERPEIRLMAELQIAQAALGDKGMVTPFYLNHRGFMTIDGF